MIVYAYRYTEYCIMFLNLYSPYRAHGAAGGYPPNYHAAIPAPVPEKHPDAYGENDIFLLN